MFRSLRPQLLLVCLTGVGAAACGNATPATSPSGPPQTLKIAVPAAIQNVSPSGTSVGVLIQSGIAELLIRPQPDGSVKPWLLQSYQQSSPTTWVLTARPNVTFQDGKPLDAAAIAACLQAILKGAAFHDSLVGSTITSSANQVTITTSMPSVFVPEDLANQSRYPIFDAAAVAAAAGNVDALTTGGIYTGPFAVTGLTTTALTAKANPSYWGGAVKLPRLSLQTISDPEARLQAVTSGSVDMAFSPPDDAPRVLQGNGSAFYRRAAQATRSTTMVFNENRAPFNDPVVRQAFSLGIDYKGVAAATNGVLDAADGFAPSYLPWHTADQPSNPDQAKQLLAQDGWTPGSDGVLQKDGTRLSFTYLWGANDGRPDEQTVGLALRDQLRAIGMDVNVTSTPSMFNVSAIPADFGVGVYPVTIQGIGNNPTESILDVFIFHLNVGGINNPQLKPLVFQIGATADASARNQLLTQMDDLIETNHLAVQLGFAPIAVVTGGAYRNFQPDSEGFLIGAQTAPG